MAARRLPEHPQPLVQLWQGNRTVSPDTRHTLVHLRRLRLYLPPCVPRLTFCLHRRRVTNGEFAADETDVGYAQPASPRGGGRTDIGGGSRWAHEATAEAIAAAAAEAEEMEAFELAEESRVREDEIEGAPLSVSLTAERDKALFTSVFTPP